MTAIIFVTLTNKGKFVYVDAMPASGTYAEFEKCLNNREENIEDIMVWGALSKPKKPGMYQAIVEYCDNHNTALTVLNWGTMAQVIDHE